MLIEQFIYWFLLNANSSCIELTQRELDNLPEYSTSIPTGVRWGKRWKRNQNFGVRGAPKLWVLGEYLPVPMSNGRDVYETRFSRIDIVGP